MRMIKIDDVLTDGMQLNVGRIATVPRRLPQRNMGHQQHCVVVFIEWEAIEEGPGLIAEFLHKNE